MISIRELAKLAGVSASTVSRCLNDSPSISIETKERIRALALANGYILQNSKHKSIMSSARKIIGVLHMRYKFFEDLFLNQILCDLYSIIENENYYAMPLTDLYGVNGIEKLRDLLKLGIFEGVIIINRRYDEVLDNYLSRISLPHVYLIYHDRKATGQERQAHVVDTDNFLGGYMATRHLIELGHKRIATLTSPLDEYADRTDGYKAALGDAGISYDHSLVFSAPVNYNGYYSATYEKTSIFKTATALFSQFDIGALGSVNALKALGYRIPEDISVVGFDGLDICEMFRPQLTTVKQPYYDLAKQTVRRLIELANTPRLLANEKQYLRPELIVRNSSAPPP